jgi:hypothetical protein
VARSRFALPRVQEQYGKNRRVFALAFYSAYAYSGVIIAGNGSWIEQILAAIHGATLFFVPKRDFLPDDFNNNIHFFIFHFLSLLYFVLIGSAIWGRKSLNRSGLWLIPVRKRNVFWGFSEGGILLAKNIIADSERAIFILPDKKKADNALFDQLDEIHATVLYRDWDKKSYLNGHRHFFLTEDEQFNMKMSVQLLNQLKDTDKCVHLYIRTESKQFYDYLNKYDAKNVEIHIFNQSDLTARLFIKENPMLDLPGIEIKNLHVKGEFNLLLLGFGRQGRELLNKCVCDSQFVGSTFLATIIDSDFSKSCGDYPVLYDECIKVYNLSLKTETVGNTTFYEWINTKIKDFGRIIIALGNDEINIDTAEKIAKVSHKNGIFDTQKIVFACVRESDCYSGDFTQFGKLTDIYTKDLIVNENMDSTAKMVNFVYNSKEKQVEKIDWEQAETLWKSTSLFNKDSSRAVVANINNINKIAEKNIKELNRVEFEILSENEHLRWNAFHLVRGIRRWKLNEINTDNAKLNNNNGNLLKHGCIVPYSELGKISDKVNKIRKNKGTDTEKGMVDYAETDRRIVRYFPLFEQELIYKNQSK